MRETKSWSSGLYVLMTKGIRNRPLHGAGICDHSCRYQRRRYVLPGVWHGSLAGRSRPALLMLPRFADIFQQGNRWLNWLEKQPEGAVRPVVIESVTKIMACGTTLMGYTQWCCSSPDCCHTKKVCFRCKSRSCPHCGVKAGAQWIQYLLSSVPDCPWQHIVFTLPCQPVLVPGVPQPVVTGRDEPHCSGCDTGNLPSGRCGAGDIHGEPHMGA